MNNYIMNYLNLFVSIIILIILIYILYYFFFLKTIYYALKLAIVPARMLHYVIVITYLGLIWPL